MNNFYVGYLPKMPQDVAQVLRRALIVLFAIAMVAAIVLVVAQRRFDRSTFEFTTVRTFEGAIEAKPYPTLAIRRPGIVSQEQHFSRYLLVGVGKHGVEVSKFEGMTVELKGKLIYRAEQTMIEVMPDSIRPKDINAAVSSTRTKGEFVTIRGEIVDSKCHTGVMNPGSGKVHRDCAVRCLSGGVPPVLIEEAEPNRLLLLTNADGDPLNPAAFVDRVAEPVTVKGFMINEGDGLELRVKTITRHQ
jgi:hypothetical protein